MNNSTSIYDFTDAKRIVVSGDIHGDYEKLVYKCCVQYQMTNTLIVVAGDCGFGFHKPDKKAVPDYSIIKACGHTILCVGGAISVDRTWRMYEQYIDEEKEEYGKLMPYVYWPDERPIYDETILDGIGKNHAVDTVITHTAPSFCEKVSRANIQEWLIRDENLLDDVKYERKVMDDLHAYLTAHSHPLQYWFYGHFHDSWHTEIDGVKYQMLDIMQLHKLAPDDDTANKRSCDEYNEKNNELAKLAAKFPTF